MRKFDIAWFQEYIHPALRLTPTTIAQLLETSLLEGIYQPSAHTLEVTVPYNRPALQGIYHIVRHIVGVHHSKTLETLPVDLDISWHLHHAYSASHWLLIKNLPYGLQTPTRITARLQLNQIASTGHLITDLIEYVSLVLHVSIQVAGPPLTSCQADQISIACQEIKLYCVYEANAALEAQWLGWALALIVHELSKIYPNLKTSYGHVQEEQRSPHKIHFTAQDFKRLIGYRVESQEVMDMCRHLGIQATVAVPDSHYILEIPHWRPDLKTSVDIIEELVFLQPHKAFKTPGHRRHLTFPCTYQPGREQSTQILQHLRAKGYIQVQNFTFISKTDNARFNYRHYEAVALMNPLSANAAQLRTSTFDGLLKNLHYNLSRQVKSMHICELGKIFSTFKEVMVFAGMAYASKQKHTFDNYTQANFHSVLGDVEDLLPADYRLIPCKDIAWLHQQAAALIMLPHHNEPIGVIGQVNTAALMLKDKLLKAPVIFFEIDLAAATQPRLFKPIIPTPYPYSFKDISFVLKDPYTFQHIQDAIRALPAQLHLKDITLKNVYALNPWRHRLTIGLCFENKDNQLTEERVHEHVALIMHHLQDLILNP